MNKFFDLFLDMFWYLISWCRYWSPYIVSALLLRGLGTGLYLVGFNGSGNLVPFIGSSKISPPTNKLITFSLSLVIGGGGKLYKLRLCISVLRC